MTPRDTAPKTGQATPPNMAGDILAENIAATARPAWLDLAHKALDQAVAAAYGWTDCTPEMPEEEILRRLLALNLDRATG